MGRFESFIDGFKADPEKSGHAHAPPQYEHHAGGQHGTPVDTDKEKSSDLEKASVEHGHAAHVGGPSVVVNERGVKMTTADSGLKRSLKSRHLQMIAFGE